MASNDVEEAVKRINSHKGVIGMLIINNDGEDRNRGEQGKRERGGNFHRLRRRNGGAAGGAKLKNTKKMRGGSPPAPPSSVPERACPRAAPS